MAGTAASREAAQGDCGLTSTLPAITSPRPAKLLVSEVKIRSA